MDHVELSVHGIAKGGDGVARESGGRVVFVRGALPGDRVRARIVEQRKRHAHAVVERVLQSGPGRTEPLCPHVAEGCGGCDLQHAELIRQRELKLEIVHDVLQRIGRFADPLVNFAGGVEGFGYRTGVRCAVVGGRAGFRRTRSDEAIATPGCLTAHPLVADIVSNGVFGRAEEVVIRVGARTGERLVVASPDARGVAAGDAVVLGADEVEAGRPAVVHERAVGRRWQISATSFFQSSPEAAELLVANVDQQLIDADASGILCDLYSGVGLFAGGLSHDGPIVAVEGHPPAVADARTNLADREVTLVESRVERWRPEPADIVVADPSRRGLGQPGVEVVAGTEASTVILVSCDPAACARDARLLVDSGYALHDVRVLDLFPQTSHIETVTRFERHTNRASRHELCVDP